MKKRKLIGANNVTIRVSTFMENTDREKKGYTNIYAVDTDGKLTTLRETFINNKLYERYETEENPYKIDFDFIENGEWEEVETI